MDERRWKVGALAAATGLTVRALHHYDDLGLLVPSERTSSGHRLYTAADVRRLYSLLALRSLGLPLADIRAALDGDGFQPADAVRRQLTHVETALALQQRLRDRLVALLQTLEHTEDPSPDHLLQTIEAMTMIEKHYTADQLAQLDERRRALGDDGMAKAQQDWADLIAAAEVERLAGTDPADPRVQA